MMIDPRLESIFSLRNMIIARGEETPEFEGILTIKGKDVCHIKNHGRGGSTVLNWIAPFTRQWAEQKFLPLLVKVSSAKEPDFRDLYTKSPTTALDSMIFDKVEELRMARSSKRSSPDIMGLLASATSGDPDAVKAYQDAVAHARQPSAGSVLYNAGRLGVGSTVLFGRPNGEKTKGKILKVNRKTVTVQTLEDRGGTKAGARWKVAPSLITPST